MNHWLSIKDAEDMGIADGECHKVKIEYDPAFRFELISIDNIYWGILNSEPLVGDK